MQNAFPFLILPATLAYLYIFHGGKTGFRTSQPAAPVQRQKQAEPKVPFGEEGSQIDEKT